MCSCFTVRMFSDFGQFVMEKCRKEHGHSIEMLVGRGSAIFLPKSLSAIFKSCLQFMHLTVLELKYSDFALWTILVTCILASIYISLWTVSFKDSHHLSALRLILLAACSSAQISRYQGEYLCWRTIAEDNGAWLSSIERRQQWNCSAEGWPKNKVPIWYLEKTVAYQ